MVEDDDDDSEYVMLIAFAHQQWFMQTHFSVTFVHNLHVLLRPYRSAFDSPL